MTLLIFNFMIGTDTPALLYLCRISAPALETCQKQSRRIYHHLQKNIGLQLSADIFQISQQRQALNVSGHFKA
jgi:hypothetical protein